MKRFMFLLMLLYIVVPQSFMEVKAEDLRFLDYGDGFQIESLLPMDDEGILLTGHTFVNGASQEGFTYEEGQTNPRTDAFAVMLDKHGQERWRLRIGDPEAINSFSQAALLNDGRILLTYRGGMGTWGIQHYIVSTDGKVEEMLSSKALNEMGIRQTLRPVEGGFLAGGYAFDGMLLEPMKETPFLQFLTRDLNEAWRLEDDLLKDCLFENVSVGEDGFLFTGTYYERTPISLSAEGLTLLRLDADGAILWHKKYPVQQEIWIQNAVLLPDGSVLACGSGDPGNPENPLPGGTLSKFDKEGNHLWTKGYHFTIGLYMLSEIVPMGDGFVITDGYAGSGAYSINADGEVLGRYRPPLEDPDALRIATASNGSVYAFGTHIVPTDEVKENGEFCRSYYVKLDASAFQPIER